MIGLLPCLSVHTSLVSRLTCSETRLLCPWFILRDSFFFLLRKKATWVLWVVLFTWRSILVVGKRGVGSKKSPHVLSQSAQRRNAVTPASLFFCSFEDSSLWDGVAPVLESCLFSKPLWKHTHRERCICISWVAENVNHHCGTV